VLKPNMQFPAKTRYVDIPGMSTEPFNYWNLVDLVFTSLILPKVTERLLSFVIS